MCTRGWPDCSNRDMWVGPTCLGEGLVREGPRGPGTSSRRAPQSQAWLHEVQSPMKNKKGKSSREERLSFQPATRPLTEGPAWSPGMQPLKLGLPEPGSAGAPGCRWPLGVCPELGQGAARSAHLTIGHPGPVWGMSCPIPRPFAHSWSRPVARRTPSRRSRCWQVGRPQALVMESRGPRDSGRGLWGCMVRTFTRELDGPVEILSGSK